MAKENRYGACCTLAVLTLLAGAVYAGDEPRNTVHDEWEPIRYLVVASREIEGEVQLNSLAKVVTAVATRLGVKVVVSDHDKETQDKIREDLKKPSIVIDGKKVPALEKDSRLITLNNPLPTDWARDHAPVNVFLNTKKGLIAALSGVDTFDTAKESQQSVTNIKKELVVRHFTKLPVVKLPDGDAPLSVEGGDWMTSERRTLVTTTTLYNDNRGTNTLEATIKAVDRTLRLRFGITKVIALKPLDKKAGKYALENAHVDLQVRTLPGKEVDGVIVKRAIVAETPEGDEQHDILDANAKALKDAGFEVIRIKNADKQLPDEIKDDVKFFKTYTNALFINKFVLIPKYGDPEMDKAAVDAYEAALNPDPNKKTFTIVPLIDAAESIKACGAMRCAAREISAPPAIKKAPQKKAAAKGSTNSSFNSTTGELHFDSAAINFIGNFNDTDTDPAFANDPMLGATMSVTGLVYEPVISGEDQFNFVDGSIVAERDGEVVFTADLPILNIFRDVADGLFEVQGYIDNLEVVASNPSAWLDTFEQTFIHDPGFETILFAETDVDLIGLTSGFTSDMPVLPLTELGLVAAPTAPEPATGIVMLMVLAGVCPMFPRRPAVRGDDMSRHQAGSAPAGRPSDA